MVSPALLEVFQAPPNRPDEGTIKPFTAYERKAIDEYNEATEGIEETIDIDGSDLYHGIRAGTPELDEAEARSIINSALGALHDWWTALDSLDATLRPLAFDGGPSNAALRLLEHQATEYFRAVNVVRREATRYFMSGDAGHGPVHSGYVETSNGTLMIHGGAVA